jgi:hypothetical protein
LLGGNLAYQAGLISPAEAASPPQVQEVIRARLIELVAPDGKVVGQLHTSEDGSANLRLRSGSGEVRVKLGASKDGSGLVLMDNNTEPAVALYAQIGGGIATLAEGGKSRKVVAE